MAEKDVHRGHTSHSLDSNFSFCTTLLITPKVKKINKALSNQSEQFLLLFDLKDWVSKLNLRLNFDLQ